MNFFELQKQIPKIAEQIPAVVEEIKAIRAEVKDAHAAFAAGIEKLEKIQANFAALDLDVRMLKSRVGEL